MTIWSYHPEQQLGTLKVDGGLTVSQVGAVRDSLLQAFSQADRVLVDLTASGDIDLAGLQLLCSAHRHAVARGKTLALAGGSERLRALVRASGFDRGTLCPEGRDSPCFWSGMA